jgi:hypothetical protein
MRYPLPVLVLLFICCIARSQGTDETNPFTLKAELASRYPWRGFPGAKSPHVLPAFEFSKKGFWTGISGDFSLGDHYYEEIDLYIGYKYKNFSLAVLDYYMPRNDSLFKGMWVYDDANTNHIFDMVIQVDGPSGFPAYLMFSAILYFESDAEGTEKKIAPYLEAGYPFHIGELLLKTFCGASLADGFYSTGHGIINAGFMAEAPVNITERFQMPLRLYFINNFLEQDAYLAVSIVIQAF